MRPFIIHRRDDGSILGICEAAERFEVSCATNYTQVNVSKLIGWETSMRGLRIPAAQLLCAWRVVPGLKDALDVIADPNRLGCSWHRNGHLKKQSSYRLIYSKRDDSTKCLVRFQDLATISLEFWSFSRIRIGQIMWDTHLHYRFLNNESRRWSNSLGSRVKTTVRWRILPW